MFEVVDISYYLEHMPNVPVIDVRSPGEFEKGHIPGATNIPLFTNEERAAVGTVYKRKSKEEAIELGYTFVTPKLDYFINKARELTSNSGIVIHCWRGGMRSKAFAEHLANNGIEHATHLNDVLGDTEPNDGDIECRTLDSFNLTDVDYVKIDVDGFEIPLLEGARNTLKTNSPTINIEMKRRKRPLIVHKAKEILTGLGYTYQSRVNSDEIWTKS